MSVHDLRPVPPLESLTVGGAGFKQFQNVDAWEQRLYAWREGLLYAPTRNQNGLWEVFFPDTVRALVW